jgi:hypothetical protein
MPPTPSGFVSGFAALSSLLACPGCHGELRMNADHVVCVQCARTYPIIDGIPVLIADADSIPELRVSAVKV